MIGVHNTIDKDGRGLSVRYRRVNGVITILGIHSHGKDVWGGLSSIELQRIRQEIKGLK